MRRPSSLRSATEEKSGDLVSRPLLPSSVPTAPSRITTRWPSASASGSCAAMPLLEEGSQAPDFTAKTHDGRTVRLSDFKGKPVVLWFYPKADTPG
ncbi:MAG: redoxin domain-containing protein [Deltaproteobacteria bacterium]|nr:MAG: redoxin domain-containing protein [Deltaproteobacteria bacterium]